MKYIYFGIIIVLFVFTACTKEEIKKTAVLPEKLHFQADFGPYITLQTNRKFVLTFQTEKLQLVQAEFADGKNKSLMGDTEAVQFHRMEYQTALPVFQYRILSDSLGMDNKGGRISNPNFDEFRFAVYGETAGTDDVHTEVADALASYQPGFVIHTGNMTSDGSNPKLWESFFQQGWNLFSQTVLLPSVGAGEENSSLIQKLFPLINPDTGYYVMDYPGVTIIVLNTEAALDENSSQYKWFTEQLAGAKGSWKIVVMNRSPYSSNKENQGSAEFVLQRAVIPLLEKYHVSLVLSGRDHLYERYEKNHVTYLTTGGGGSTLYHGKIEANPYRLKLVTGKYNFAVADVTERRLIIRVFSERKEVLDSFNIIE